MTAKCGQQRVHHRAHRTAICDEWWEPETQWHRDWKNEFPEDWQETRITAPDGDFHIADVRTPGGTVLEFQHSPLSAVDRQSRETFYGRMAWIVDGRRKENDLPAFWHLLSFTTPDYGKMRGWRLPLRRLPLIETWIVAASPVYLDFGGENFSGMGLPSVELLWRISKASNGRIIVTPFSRQSIIDHYKLDTPLEGFDPHPKPPNC